MPIIPKQSQDSVDKIIDEQVKRLEKAVIYNLCIVGEKVCNQARSTESYKDQTGNLRSSIGYIIVKDGKALQKSDFKKVFGNVKSKEDGSKIGKNYSKEIAQRFHTGLALIVVAGMKYASYVSNKGYDVLDSSELLAQKLVPKMLKDLGFK